MSFRFAGDQAPLVCVLLPGACKQCPTLGTEPPLRPDFHPTFRCTGGLAFAAMLEVLGHGAVDGDEVMTLLWLCDSTPPMPAHCTVAVKVMGQSSNVAQPGWSVFFANLQWFRVFSRACARVTSTCNKKPRHGLRINWGIF